MDVAALSYPTHLDPLAPTFPQQGTPDNGNASRAAVSQPLLKPTPLCCKQAFFPATAPGGPRVARGAVGGGGSCGLAGGRGSGGQRGGGCHAGPPLLSAVRTSIVKDSQRARSALLTSIAGSSRDESTRIGTGGTRETERGQRRASAPAACLRKRRGGDDGGRGAYDSLRMLKESEVRATTPLLQGPDGSPRGEGRGALYRRRDFEGKSSRQEKTLAEREEQAPIAGDYCTCHLLVENDGLDLPEDKMHDFSTVVWQREQREQPQRISVSGGGFQTKHKESHEPWMEQNETRQRRPVTGAPSHGHFLPSTANEASNLEVVGTRNGCMVQSVDGSPSGTFASFAEYSGGGSEEIVNRSGSKSRDRRTISPPRQPSAVRRLKLRLEEMGQ